jgi:hypothetical protein
MTTRNNRIKALEEALGRAPCPFNVAGMQDIEACIYAGECTCEYGALLKNRVRKNHSDLNTK